VSNFLRLRALAIAIVTAVAALALLVAPVSATKPPRVMAALGDSITRAFNSSGPGCPTGPSLDCPANSWSTGTNPVVNSQLQRLEAMHPGSIVAYNDAVSGARAGGPNGLLPQAEAAAAQHPDYVTIQIGANGALAQACAEFKRCLYDDGAIFESSFTAADVATVTNTEGLNIFPFDVLPVIGAGYANSTADYFHPSLQGQAQLAEVSWSATFRDFVARTKHLLTR
jgi:lysophospholipase L1-like esterase